MNRRNFVKQTCLACMTGLAFSEILQGCSGVKYSPGTLQGDDLVAPLSEFMDKKNPGAYRKFVVLQHDSLKYPICVYRFSDSDYEALLLRCTHQGTELRVFGDRMQCPAHGSEFTSRGEVQEGPADKPLRKFPVSITDDQIKISLK